MANSFKLFKRPRLPKLPAPRVFTRGPRNLQSTIYARNLGDTPGDVPAGLVATKPEWYCYWSLLKLGKVPDIDFDFQSSINGGRLELAGLVLDFYMKNPPGIGINIHGLHWHYGMGRDRIVKDRMQRGILEGKGIHLVVIDEDDILRNPVYYTKEALSGRDYSKMVLEF